MDEAPDSVETWRKQSDGYRTKMDQIAADRDRLRAVVDADPLWRPVLAVLANIDAAPQDSDVFELSVSPAVTALRTALRHRRELLDGSAEATDG